MFADGVVKGVVGVDLTLDDVLADVVYFNDGGDSYAFLVDRDGMTLSHPGLPLPSDVESDPVLIHITLLETFPGMDSLLADMFAGNTGSVVLEVGLILDRVGRVRQVYAMLMWLGMR